MTELVDRALAWVDDVHPHAPHLARTREWVLELDPEGHVATCRICGYTRRTH